MYGRRHYTAQLLVYLVERGIYHVFLTCFFFFFQAEDGIRDLIVTGVQTCALPISRRRGSTHRRAARRLGLPARGSARDRDRQPAGLPEHRHCRGRERAGPLLPVEIGRASCRERV